MSENYNALSHFWIPTHYATEEIIPPIIARFNDDDLQERHLELLLPNAHSWMVNNHIPPVNAQYTYPGGMESWIDSALSDRGKECVLDENWTHAFITVYQLRTLYAHDHVTGL